MDRRSRSCRLPRPWVCARPLISPCVVSTSLGPTGFPAVRELGRRQNVAARQGADPRGGASSHRRRGARRRRCGGVGLRLASHARLPCETVRATGCWSSTTRCARQVVAGALGSAGFEVDLAASPTEALSVLADQTFDAIVMDYVLPPWTGRPWRDGFGNWGSRFRSYAAVRGRHRRGRPSAALAAGANVYLDKDDLRQGALAAAITNLISWRPE